MIAEECELFGLGDLSPFSPLMKKSSVSNFEILGAPIGDLIFCAKFVAHNDLQQGRMQDFGEGGGGGGWGPT